MKKLLILLFFTSLGFSGYSQISFGLGGTYLDDFGVQARASLDATEDLGLIPQFSYYFVDGLTAISVDANLTYGVAEVGDGSPIYVLGGIDWTRVSNDGFSNSEFGFNAGGGIQISNIYGEVFFRKLFCDGCDGEIGLNLGYMF